MANPQKLYIYDQSSEIDRKQAAGRFGDDDGVLTIGVPSERDLLNALHDLTNKRMTFNRALFQTHGGPGGIWFSNDWVSKYTIDAYFAPFAALFPHAARIYFDGCNVADGGDGTDFLLKVGEVLLVNGGGETMGWTTLGHGVWGWVPFIGGHTIHFGGEDALKRIRFFPGGEPDFADSWIP